MEEKSFLELTKVDYVCNNLSESFNSWIKAFKGLHLVDLLDQIRQLIMDKFAVRRVVANNKFKGPTLPNVIKELNELSRNCGRPRVLAGGDEYCEISGFDNGKEWRHVVELDTQQCSCREWQITGKPCKHAVSFICTIKGAKLEDYVDECYSVAKFKAAYASKIPGLTGKSLWKKVTLPYKVHPHVAKRPPGRPRKQRILGCLEPGSRRHQCKRCKQFGHQQRTCKVGEEGANKRKRRNRTQDSESVTQDGASVPQDGASVPIGESQQGTTKRKRGNTKRNGTQDGASVPIE